MRGLAILLHSWVNVSSALGLVVIYNTWDAAIAYAPATSVSSFDQEKVK